MFKNIFTRKKKPEKKSVGQTSIPIQNNSLLGFALGYADGYNKLSYHQAMDLYGQGSSLATAVDIILQELSNISPVLCGPNKSIDDQSEVIQFLKNPNDFNETWSSFVTNLGLHLLLTGNSHMYMAGNVKMKPLELYSIKPQNTSVVQALDTYPWYYTINVGPGSTTSNTNTNQSQYKRDLSKTGYRFYTSDQMREIWHIRRQSSSSENILGDSPIKAICLDIDQQIKGRIHNKNLLSNGARPSAAAIFKDTMNNDQHNERRDNINEQMAGANQAGKILVMSSSDMSFTEMGVTNKDMDYAGLDKIADTAVYNRYRIPLPLVSNDAATFNNRGQSVPDLYDFAVLPTNKILMSGISMAILPRFGLDPSKYYISYDPDEIEALKERRLKELKERKEIGVETPNEIRASMSNRDPVDGGDVILVQSSMVPINEVSLADTEETMTPEEEAEALALRDGA